MKRFVVLDKTMTDAEVARALKTAGIQKHASDKHPGTGTGQEVHGRRYGTDESGQKLDRGDWNAASDLDPRQADELIRKAEDVLGVDRWDAQEDAVRIRTKRAIVDKLTDQLYKNWDVVEAAEKWWLRNKNYNPQGDTVNEIERNRVKAWVNAMIKNWSFTSSNDGRAIAWQVAVGREIMGLDIDPHTQFQWASDHFIEQAHQILSEEGEGMKALARQMYTNTQDLLAQQGVRELVVFRGMGWANEEAAPDWLVEISDRNWHEGRGLFPPANARPGFQNKQPVGTKVILGGNPLQSATGRYEVAKEFATQGFSGTRGTLLAMHVPAASVFSTAVTGQGALNEMEIVVLDNGSGSEASAMDIDSLPSYIQPYDLFTKHEWIETS